MEKTRLKDEKITRTPPCTEKLIKLSRFLPVWLKKRLLQHRYVYISYGKIDLKDKVWLEVSTDMKQVSRYFEQGMDQISAQRFRKDVIYWDTLDSAHQSYLQSYYPNCKRFDISIFNEDSLEFLSVTYQGDKVYGEFYEFYKILHAISFEMNKILRKEKKLRHYSLPYRLCPDFGQSLKLRNKVQSPFYYLIEDQKKFCFHDVFLTELELKYIGCMLSLMSFKEMSYHFSCSDTAIRKKVAIIKKKLGNEYMSNSSLFKVLSLKGVLVACEPKSLYKPQVSA